MTFTPVPTPGRLTRLRLWIARTLGRSASLSYIDALCVVVVGAAAVALAQAILHRGWDYDEMEHAHAAWLVARGVKPFNDFFECHPPFLWYPLGLLFRIFGDSYDVLFVLRFIAAAGHIVFMVAVLKNAALSLRQLPAPAALPPWTAALCAAFIAVQPAIFEYLVEFRLDAWPNAVLVIAIYRYRRRRENAWRASVELAALSMAAVLCSPKLIVFAGLFALLGVATDDRRLVRVAGMLAGGAGALGIGAVLLLLAGLNPIAVYRLSLLYHDVLNTKGGFGHGLINAVGGQAVARNVVIASVLAWLATAWQRLRRATFEIAALAFLLLQLKLVSFGYKQYFSPWYLLAIAFIPYLEVLLRRRRALHALAVACALVYLTGNVLEVSRNYRSRDDARENIRSRKELEALVPPGHFMVATIWSMPLFRRVAFYQVANSLAPSGFDTTRVMQSLKISPYSEEFTVERARAELEARRPDLIMIGSHFAPYQRAALDEYVAKHESEYARQQCHDIACLVRKP